MGKQINFRMDMDMESQFWSFLKSINGLEFIMKKDGKNINVEELSDDYYNKIIIYNKGFGELTTLKKGITINTIFSPVIEFSRTYIDLERKQISNGRLWVEMKYWNENEELVEKPKELDKLYQKLARWIRKNIPKVEVDYGDCKLNEHVTPVIKRMIEEEGYNEPLNKDYIKKHKEK